MKVEHLVQWELDDDETQARIGIPDGQVPSRGDHVYFALDEIKARCVVEHVHWSVGVSSDDRTHHSVAIVVLKRSP